MDRPLDVSASATEPCPQAAIDSEFLAVRADEVEDGAEALADLLCSFTTLGSLSEEVEATMPKFDAISHLDLSVSDVERSAQWYIGTLGLREVGRSDFGDRIMIVLRHDESGLIIGLNQHGEQTADRFDEHSPGLDHVGFAVAERDELDAWQVHLEEQGVDHSPIEDAPSGVGTALVFRDPDNIQLEFWWSAPR